MSSTMVNAYLAYTVGENELLSEFIANIGDIGTTSSYTEMEFDINATLVAPKIDFGAVISGKQAIKNGVSINTAYSDVAVITYNSQNYTIGARYSGSKIYFKCTAPSGHTASRFLISLNQVYDAGDKKLLFSNFGMLPMNNTYMYNQTATYPIDGSYITMDDGVNQVNKPIKFIQCGVNGGVSIPTWSRRVNRQDFDSSTKLTVGMWKAGHTIANMQYTNSNYLEFDVTNMCELTLAQGTLSNRNERSTTALYFPSTGRVYSLTYSKSDYISEYDSSQKLSINWYNFNDPNDFGNIITIEPIPSWVSRDNKNAYIYTTFCKKMGKLIVQVTSPCGISYNDIYNSSNYYQAQLDPQKMPEFGNSPVGRLIGTNNTTLRVSFLDDARWVKAYPYCFNFPSGGSSSSNSGSSSSGHTEIGPIPIAHD